MYYVYMLRCRDESIYSGIAADLCKRMSVHFDGGKDAAKYVVAHGAAKLEAYWICENKSQASKLEYRIKRLTKDKKEKLILAEAGLEKFFAEGFECDVYTRGRIDAENLKKFTAGGCCV